MIALLPCLLFVSAFPSKLNSIGGHNNHHNHHDHDEDVAASRSIESYLSPVEYEDEEVSASRVVDSYLIPVEYDEEPAASQAVDSYLVPDEQPAAQEPVRTFAKVMPGKLDTRQQTLVKQTISYSSGPSCEQGPGFLFWPPSGQGGGPNRGEGLLRNPPG